MSPIVHKAAWRRDTTQDVTNEHARVFRRLPKCVAIAKTSHSSWPSAPLKIFYGADASFFWLLCLYRGLAKEVRQVAGDLMVLDETGKNDIIV